MRRTWLAAALLLILSSTAVPTGSAHIIKSEGCGGAPYVDTNPLDNGLLGPDPDAVVVVHAACVARCKENIEPLGYDLLDCWGGGGRTGAVDLRA